MIVLPCTPLQKRREQNLALRHLCTRTPYQRARQSDARTRTRGGGCPPPGLSPASPAPPERPEYCLPWTRAGEHYYTGIVYLLLQGRTCTSCPLLYSINRVLPTLTSQARSAGTGHSQEQLIALRCSVVLYVLYVAPDETPLLGADVGEMSR